MVVDDFEYEQGSFPYGADDIPAIWWGMCADLSQECGMVHRGAQSMRMTVRPLPHAPRRGEIVMMPACAEAVHTWDPPQDWNEVGVNSLILYFVGAPDNRAYPLYLRISDGAGATAVIVHPDPNAVRTTDWQRWQIAMAEAETAGVNLAAVQQIAIGVGDPAQSPPAVGPFVLYIDDVLLTMRMP